ncbi:MAG: alpha/beta fold hydrolase [Maricaulaceae bacterium]|jgi:pimeloyl-ACP methyl ester carboxylesterase
MSFLRVFAPAAALTLIACASFPAVPASSSLESDLWIVDAGPAGSFQAISGAFEVPAVRDDPSAGVFTLQYIRLLSTATEPAAPVVYLAGGPGDAATPIAEQPFAVAALASWLETADVVLLDQRGVGASGPDTSVSNDEHIPRDFFVDEQSALEHRMTIDAAARTILESRGVPLAGLTVQESADDVEALRRHLGLDRVSLYGFSYGTHLALSVIRRHPDSVERAVLVGTEGPDHTLKPPLSLDERLHDLAQLAAISPELSGEEDLVAVFDRVSARLDQEPVLVSVRPPAGQAMSVPVGAFGLHLIMRHDIGDATDLPVFPRLLYALDRGDTAMLGWFVQRRSFWLTETSAHLFMTDGSSGGSPDRLSMVARDREISGFGNAANFPLPDIIDVWSRRQSTPTIMTRCVQTSRFSSSAARSIGTRLRPKPRRFAADFPTQLTSSSKTLVMSKSSRMGRRGR